MRTARDLALETLQLEQDGRVLTARFSNPPLNFMTTGFIRELDQLTRSVDLDPTVGAVVLTGGVKDRFLTHLDAQELAGIQDLPHPQLSMRAARVVVLVLNFVLRLPGVASLLERFGGAPGKGIVMGHRWKRLTLRMNRSAVRLHRGDQRPRARRRAGDRARLRPALRRRQPCTCAWGRWRCSSP